MSFDETLSTGARVSFLAMSADFILANCDTFSCDMLSDRLSYSSNILLTIHDKHFVDFCPV